MKLAGMIVLVVVVFIVGFFVGDRLATQRMQIQVSIAKGETTIYRSQAERLSAILRGIRQAAAQATVIEKAQ